MTEPRTIVGIDVGTTKICTLVGELYEDGQLRIIGVGVAPSRGLHKGVVVNVNEATEAISASVQKAERISGYQITSAYVGVGGGHVTAINSRGVVGISRSARGISQFDIDRALDAARAIAIPHNREIIHAIPRGYIVDDQEGVKDPIGMQGIRLEVEVHIVTGASTSVSNLVKCVRAAEVEIDDLILQSLASGEAILKESEREMGVVLADIGGGTTDVAIFIEGSIWHTIVLGTGGEHLTHDVAVGLRTPFDTAEELKIKYGHAIPRSLATDELIEVSSFGNGARQSVSRLQLSEVIEARAEEILMLVLREVKRSGYDGLLAAGLVMCGGSAELSGFKDLGQQILQVPVRVGRPHDLQGLTDVLESPAYATAVGLLLWGMRQRPTAEEEPSRVVRIPGELWPRIRDWFRAFLPG
ncbi:MAG: cell division protein FtsA [Anaerolineae bacterium]|jgi:cell division protein FtsA